MKKQHTIWLDSFLQNCKESNKSEHTLINYRCDLQKYINWYEIYQEGLLNQANAQTISAYKAFLTSEDSVYQQKINEEKLRSGRKRDWAIYKIKLFFKKMFNRRKERPLLANPNGNNPLLPSSSIIKSMTLAVTSRRRHLSAIKNFYEFLKQSHEDTSNLFPTNPVRPKLHAIKLKDEDVENTKLLRAEDWEHLLNLPLRPRERLIVHLLYFGGLRLSELSALPLKAFDSQKKSITFVRKGGYVHTLYIQKPEMIFNLLNIYLSVRKEEGPFLFVGRKGKAITSRAMYDIIMKLIRKALCPTIGLTPHSFRKACASNLYEETKDIILVRDYLNHADAKVTQTYIERVNRQTKFI